MNEHEPLHKSYLLANVLFLQWSIDDGDVYGISPAQCAYARAASAREVERGLSPSWPGTADCANDTVYTTSRLYAHVVPLTQGTHTLRIGLVALDELPVSGVGCVSH